MNIRLSRSHPCPAGVGRQRFCRRATVRAQMRKSTAFALLATVLVAIVLRLSPLSRFLYWGADIGEYYAILRSLAVAGWVVQPYVGWGVVYPYFPGVFFPQAALASLSGLSPIDVATVLTPILGALVVVPIFLIAVSITGDRRAGLVVASFAAVAMPFVYTASHTAPTTLGNLFVVTALLLFLRLRTDRRAWVPLVVVTIALVVTHHLSTYFLIIMVLGAILLRGLVRPATRSIGFRREVAYAGLLLAATFGYWFGYATPLGLGVLRDVNVEPWWLLLVAFFVLLAAAAGLVLLRRGRAWRYRPKYPEVRRSAAIQVAALIAIGAFLAYWVLFGVWGTTIAVPAAGALYFMSVLVLVTLGAPGRKFFDFLRRGLDPSAWFIAVVGSIALAAFVAPRPLLPYRQVEYVVLPIILFAGALPWVLDLWNPGRARRAGVAAAIGVLLVASASTAIPPPELLGGWQEGIRPEALDPSFWAREHIGGLVVADHRASTVLFGFGGVAATWDTSRTPFFVATFPEAEADLVDIPSPSGTRNASLVWIDRDIQQGVQLYPWEPALPMPAEAFPKFSQVPFVKVFDTGYAQLYWIAWGCDETC